MSIRMEKVFLGGGAFGKVFKGTCKGRVVAVKRMKKGQNEINILSALNHENIVELVGHKFDDKYFYLAMNMCTGSASDLLAKNGKFEGRTFGLFLKDVSAGLQYLYRKKIFHRDIKPDNILYIAEPGMDFQFQIADFGFATIFKDYAVKFDKGCGTFDYMHPDILGIYCRKSVQYGIETDIHSLAVTLFEVVTCELPFNYKEHAESQREYAENLLKIIVRKPDGCIGHNEHGYYRYFANDQHKLGNEILTKRTEILLSNMLNRNGMTWDQFFWEAANVHPWAF